MQNFIIILLLFVTASLKSQTDVISNNRKPDAPEVKNSFYDYKNESLKNYKISVWNVDSSYLFNGFLDYLTIDTNGLIWLSMYDRLLTFDGVKFEEKNKTIFKRAENFRIFDVESDSNNNLWLYANNNIYSFSGEKLIKYNPKKIGIEGATRITYNQRSGEVFFCSDDGLAIYNDGKWDFINQSSLKGLPSDRVLYANRDSRNRLWIGTFGGTVMINKDGKLTAYNNHKNTPLYHTCIDNFCEDKDGNLYFSLFYYPDKYSSNDNKQEGIAVYSIEGVWNHYNLLNSGLPVVHISYMVIDTSENVLWLSTHSVGLIRFDYQNNTWDNYHQQNSDIPDTYISKMVLDKHGILYLATRQGLVKIEKKN